MHAGHKITELRNSSKVKEVARAVASDADWQVNTEVADGPVPNPVDVFADHNDGYEVVDKKTIGDSEFVYVAEV